MGKAAKYYVVTIGREPGIYRTWSDCESQVKQFPGAKFKAFLTEDTAKHAFKHGWDTPEAPVVQKSSDSQTSSDEYIKESLSVDAACSGNPGPMEYQCVHTGTESSVFASHVYPVGTNNLGEFLAVVDALKYLKEKALDLPVYTDSKSAIAWVRDKRVKTTLKRDESTEALWVAVEDALQWLLKQSQTNTVLKWQTEQWGESKADYGRK